MQHDGDNQRMQASASLPHFLCIGVQRGATTWLHQSLSGHPEAFLPEKKEVHYFNQNLDKGIDWYQSFFRNIPESAKVSGECTPTYFHEASFELIKKTLPDVKLILIFREPLSRALSAYSLLHSHYPGASFEECCQKTRYFIDLSLYSVKLKELYRTFSNASVMTMLHDDVEENAQSALSNVCTFLGIDSSFRPIDIEQRINQVVRPDLQDSIRNAGLGWLITMVKSNRITDRIARSMLSSKPRSSEPKLSLEFRRQLKETFLGDVKELEPLIHRDLTRWKQRLEELA